MVQIVNNNIGAFMPMPMIGSGSCYNSYNTCGSPSLFGYPQAGMSSCGGGCGGCGGGDDGLGKAMLIGAGVGVGAGLLIGFGKPILKGLGIAGKAVWSGMKWAGNGIWQGMKWLGNGIVKGAKAVWNGITGLFSKKDKTVTNEV